MSLTTEEMLALARFRLLDSRNCDEAAKDRLLAQMADEIERLRRPAREPFNANHYVWVRLTQVGHMILLRRGAPPKREEDGWSRWQLWDLMYTFGAHMSMVLSPPFEMRIEFERERPTPATSVADDHGFCA